jgi:selT/selW/selH-like putative selenoprotein
METLLDHYEPYIGKLILKPSDGGRFEVSVDHTLVFSRLDVGRFPGAQELVRLVGAQIGA